MGVIIFVWCYVGWLYYSNIKWFWYQSLHNFTMHVMMNIQYCILSSFYTHNVATPNKNLV